MMLLVDTKVDVNYKDGGIRMEKIPNAVYTKEFREEAVRMVLEHNLSAYEVAQNLSIPKSTINYRVREARKGRLFFGGQCKEILIRNRSGISQSKT